MSRAPQSPVRVIDLHELTSTHPSVIYLHRVIESKAFTHVTTEHCDNNIFTQILHSHGFLGEDELATC